MAPRKGKKLAVGATEDEKGFEEEVTLDEIFFLSKHLWESLPELEKLKYQGKIVLDFALLLLMDTR